VAQMNGFSNFHTLRASATGPSQRAETGSTVAQRFLTDSLSNVLKKHGSPINLVNATKASAIEGILNDCQDDQHIVYEYQEAAMFSAIVAVDPNHVSTMLRTVPLLIPDGDREGGAFARNENWYDLIIERCELISDELAKIPGELRQQVALELRPIETMFYCYYALAMGAWERNDYLQMATYLETAARMVHRVESGHALRPTADLAAAAWMVIGEFARAHDAYAIARCQDTSDYGAMLRCFSAVSRGEAPDADDVKVVQDNGLIYEVLAAIERSPEQPIFVNYGLAEEEEGLYAPIFEVLQYHFLGAAAAGCSIDSSVAEWVVKASGQQKTQPSLH